jgi:hypothetical protein
LPHIGATHSLKFLTHRRNAGTGPKYGELQTISKNRLDKARVILSN